MGCDLSLEVALREAGHEIVAGIDEAGRGPLAGPVVAAAVILPNDFAHEVLNDSKKLSAGKREALFDELTTRDDIAWASASVEPKEIDRLNILKATHRAMARAVSKLASAPDMALIDGLPVPNFPFPQQAVVKGDGKSLSIAAASIIAKVSRDRTMLKMAERYPGYDFEKHKGYPTPRHLEALRKLGPCPIHRRSFAPVAQQTFDF